jgi:hypothetical protein
VPDASIFRFTDALEMLNKVVALPSPEMKAILPGAHLAAK